MFEFYTFTIIPRAQWHNNLEDTHVTQNYEFITVMSHEQQYISYHQQLNCLFNSLFRLTSKEISKFQVTGLLWGEGTSDRWIPPRGARNLESISMAWHHYVHQYHKPINGWWYSEINCYLLFVFQGVFNNQSVGQSLSAPKSWLIITIHCGLVAQYGNIDLGQHWLW